MRSSYCQPYLGEGVVSGIAISPYRSLPHWGRGTALAVDRVLSQTAYLRRSFPLVFHSARTLSGSLRSPPSPRGEGFVSGIPIPPSNLRPFGAPPSIGRRECLRKPLPLEGAAERSEAELASFWGGLRRSSHLSFIPLVPYPPLRGTFPSRGRLCVGNSGIPISQPCVFLTPGEDVSP